MVFHVAMQQGLVKAFFKSFKDIGLQEFIPTVKVETENTKWSLSKFQLTSTLQVSIAPSVLCISRTHGLNSSIANPKLRLDVWKIVKCLTQVFLVLPAALKCDLT